MKKSLCLSLICAVVVLSNSTVWSQTTQPAGAVVTAQTNPATTQKATDVVATVGDKKLTRGDFELIKKYLAPGMPPEQEKRLIDAWKMTVTLSNEARKNGIESNPEVQPALKLMWDQFLGNFYVRMQQTNAVVTDAEVKKYYEENKERPEFHEGAYITGKVIGTEKREDIDAIKKQLTEGKDFDKLFEANIETTKKVTGLSDPALKNVLSTLLAENLGQPNAGAMAMVNVNEVIGPRFLPNNKGFILFKVTERKPGALIPYEKMAEQIRGFMTNEKKMKIGQEIMQRAEKEAGVVREMPPQMGPGPRSQGPMVRPSTRPSAK